jgi:hypothetical protein
LLEDKLVAERLHRIQFTVVPQALEKLQHQDPHALSDRAQSSSHGGGRLALARPGIHNDETTAQIRHMAEFLILRGPVRKRH